MDRFIEFQWHIVIIELYDLKSNMDRFIGDVMGYIMLAIPVFKIQYG